MPSSKATKPAKPDETHDLIDPAFGRPIQFKTTASAHNRSGRVTKNEMGADAMVSQFLNIKRNYHDRLREIVRNDRHAGRFFCMDDCAFIFDVNIMRTLVQTIENYGGKNGPGGVFLFQGLKKARPGERITASQQEPEVKPQQSCSFGRPTLIAAAYGRDKDGNYVHLRIPQSIIKNTLPNHKDFTEEEYDGFQHPGNGNSGGDTPPPPTPVVADNFEFRLGDKPVVVDIGDENDDTDFKIKPVITLDAIQTWKREV
jgi:hypothetical protein